MTRRHDGGSWWRELAGRNGGELPDIAPPAAPEPLDMVPLDDDTRPCPTTVAHIRAHLASRQGLGK
jgi:hypothetical protein